MRGFHNEMVDDGDKPGLRVHKTCRDIKHPAEKPLPLEDAVALRKPSPDIDDDGSDTPAPNLAETLFPDDNYFGGGT